MPIYLHLALLTLCVFVLTPAVCAALVCDTPVFDFGTRPDNEGGVSHTFEIYNAGVGTLFIGAVRASCDCLTAELSRKTLASGERMPVDVHFNFGTLSGHQDRALHLLYRRDHAPDATQEILTLSLAGTILPPVLRIPDTLDLGPLVPGTVATGTVHLICGRAGPFALGSVGLDHADARVEYTAGETATNHTLRFLIPVPQRHGDFSGLALATTDVAEQPQLPIRYQGRAAPLIEVRPTVILALRGAPVDACVTVASPHHIAFRVISATATDPRVSLRTEHDAHVSRVYVTSSVAGDALRDTLIRIRTDHPVCRVIEVPIRTATTH